MVIFFNNCIKINFLLSILEITKLSYKKVMFYILNYYLTLINPKLTSF